MGKRIGAAAIVEKKLAIYEKALQTHPDSDELIVAYLTAAQKVWEYRTTASIAAFVKVSLSRTHAFDDEFVDSRRRRRTGSGSWRGGRSRRACGRRICDSIARILRSSRY
jgi:hypothetical protein